MSANPQVCTKCGSETIIPRVHIKDRGDGYSDYGLTAVVDEHPNALVFKGPCEIKLLARVCGSCGFAEFYAESPRELWDAYRKQVNNRG